jgi:hypothetical protein
VMPPDQCPDSTQPVTTALTESSPPSTITSTAAQLSSTTVVSYTFFTTEFTWYYWYYYLTYLPIYSSTATTSSQVTAVTTVSVSATDSADATLLFYSLSNGIRAIHTPKQKHWTYSRFLSGANALTGSRRICDNIWGTFSLTV